ncbi:PR domain zinc finger protein 5-like isoform X2 [Osmia bicornis bicornis]|nr:PR domain zinc finger protein 5-like isoform X2 [Osmia bicornis bicornis]
MRVKTAPKQRMIQNNEDTDSVPEPNQCFSNDEREETLEDSDDVSCTSNTCKNDSLNKNRSVNPVDIGEEKEEAVNYSQEVLDMSIKHKSETPEGSSTTCSMAGPSSCEYSSSLLKEESDINSDNNNILISNANMVNSYSLTTCSCMDPPSSCKDKSNAYFSDEDQSIKAVNLCKKDCSKEDSLSTVGGSDEKLKDTFLYKIMTDPTFLENIKHKQSKRYTCQFCKQEFVNEDELADHMDVKKDESNQVTCCACKKTFAQKRYLRYHQRCHLERTKYSCDLCTKKYTRLDNLTRHNVFHVNPDKFPCTYCEKTFARKDLLNKHLKSHENRYRYFCEHCCKYFKGPVMLQNHNKIYHKTS